MSKRTITPRPRRERRWLQAAFALLAVTAATVAVSFATGGWLHWATGSIATVTVIGALLVIRKVPDQPGSRS